MEPSKRAAAVSYICGLDGSYINTPDARFEGLILVVWNKRYGGWTLPGGMVEDDETIEQAQERELMEETGLVTIHREPIYKAPIEFVVDPHRGNIVHVFRVMTSGKPREREVGCPVTYFKREEFLRWCPFRAFYERMFAAVPAL